jgi:hypothetical protein
LQALKALVSNCLLYSVKLGQRIGVNIRQALVVG